MANLTVASDEVQLAELAAERITRLIVQAVADRGSACVSLAGGNTPRRLYANLADPTQSWRDRIPWPQVHLFWGDERHVPPDHPDSNYGMAKAALIDHVPIPADHVHRIRGEMKDPQEAADDYDRELTRAHAFDLMLLGLGEDAHIASIFPGSELLEIAIGHPFAGRPDHDHVGRPFTGRRVAAVWAPHLNARRITLTPAAILDSRAILALVAGARKANAVHAALEAPHDVRKAPAQLLRAAGDRMEWFLDRSAAARL